MKAIKKTTKKLMFLLMTMTLVIGLTPVAAYAETYTVDVFGGVSSAENAETGEIVTITANEAPDGQAFCYWECKTGGVTFDNSESYQTTFVMPEDPVEVKAHFTDILIDPDSIADQVYTGTPIEPEIGKAELDGVDWAPQKNTDYTVTYKNNTNAGTAALVVTMLGNRPGKREVPFTINAADITSAEVTFEDQTYNGTALEPVPTVTWNGQDLTIGVDYTLTYGNNVNAGEANVTLDGIGNFCGKIEGLSFRINKPAEKPVYKAVSGSGGTYTKESGKTLSFTFKRSADDETTFNLFTGIAVDGKAVPEKNASGKANWTAKSGSVIVELQPAYLETLSVGKHQLTANFDDGGAVTVEFTVKTKSATTMKSPRTGDTNHSVLWCLLLLASGAVILGAGRARRRGR